MSLQDPLAAYRAGPARSVSDLEDHLTATGQEVMHVWASGEHPAALSQDRFVFAKEGTLYQVPKDELKEAHRVRDTHTGMIRWGLGTYLLALPVTFFDLLLALVMAVLGGALVTKAYLSYALVIEVADDRVPPMGVENRKAKQIQQALNTWKRQGASER